MRNHVRIEKQIVQADAKGNWTYAFKNLLVNDENGQAYVYTIEGTTITNTYKSNGMLPETGGRYKQTMIYAGLAIVLMAILSGVFYGIKHRND